MEMCTYSPPSLLFAILLALVFLSPTSGLRVLVLGGTGFVGQAMVQKLAQRGHTVTSLSRRSVSSTVGVTYVQGDATDAPTVEALFAQQQDAVVHCIGLLLDSQSGLVSLNKLASGSGSVPSSDATYDTVTRKSAFNLLDSIQQDKQTQKQIPVVFVSAAEAAWPFPAPVKFLQRYLEAKRAVERRMQESSPFIRPVILRPSLIYTLQRPQALVSVVPFYVANALGVPFIDRPVTVETLVDAAVFAIEGGGGGGGEVSGIQTYREMEALAARLRPIR